MTAPLWRIAVSVPAEVVDAVARMAERLCQSVSVFEAADGLARVEGVAMRRPDTVELRVALALAAAAVGCPPPAVVVEPLADRDWLAESQRKLPALRIGRYRVRGTHVEKPRLAAGGVDLVIDAGMAFGSGHHASTAGCLAALDRLGRRPVRWPLDLGCGCGILAIAIARTWHVPVLAVDIDPVAVRVAADNARRNGVGALVRARVADGAAAPAVRAGAPFDLIVANILARPLRCMAGDVARVLDGGGVAVLAGFLEPSAQGVLAAYLAQGLRLVDRIVRDGWVTLMLAR
jgi:ribosomal protein L11 methyltransferase